MQRAIGRGDDGRVWGETTVIWDPLIYVETTVIFVISTLDRLFRGKWTHFLANVKICVNICFIWRFPKFGLIKVL